MTATTMRMMTMMNLLWWSRRRQEALGEDYQKPAAMNRKLPKHLSLQTMKLLREMAPVQKDEL